MLDIINIDDLNIDQLKELITEQIRALPEEDLPELYQKVKELFDMENLFETEKES